MEIIRSISDMKARVKSWRGEGLTVGLVPTMGYLHDGHMSLVNSAVKENDRVAVSIFVNPIQFGAGEDLERYPQDMDGDCRLCKKAGVDVIFHPSESEMYPDNFTSYLDVEGITEHLCGARRPGHFKGVCTVVMKLFHITSPDKAYFGQKDIQQLAVIKRMVHNFNMDVQIVGLPIVREPDGLAMSSRNAYLNEEERRAALCLHRAVRLAEKLHGEGRRQSSHIKSRIADLLKSEPLARHDYVEIVDAESLQPVDYIDGPVICAIAVFIGGTRLIDNIVIGGAKP